VSDFVFDPTAVMVDFDEDSFKPARKEPVLDQFFEFEVTQASLAEAKSGYLTLALKVTALDSEGSPMFTKYVNIPHPAVYKGHTPPAAAASIFRSSVSALFPEWAAYDSTEADPVKSGKLIYLKDGVVVSKEAFSAADKVKNEKLAAVARQLVDSNETIRQNALHGLEGRHFFAKLQASGEYVNVKPMVAVVYKDETVIYDSKTAFGG
jgi:hypothetical protein